MIKLNTFIAVKDASVSAKWYEEIFKLKNSSPEGHGFAVLKSEIGEIILCLHEWQKDDHPTMTDRNIPPGNGLILYFRSHDMDPIYQRVKNAGYPIEENIHMNPNSMKREFSMRDPDGYFLTVSEFHEFDQ
jgi:predicted enzyme related to lactoylglutathione lyase